MYADDSCIISSSPSGLQKLIDICCQYASDNTIIYNESKTKCVCFKPKQFRHIYVQIVYLLKTKLKFVEFMKYLGVFLNEASDDEGDLVRHKRYLYAKGNSIISKFKQCSDDVKERLFRTFCYAVYGGHLWSRYKLSTFNRLTVAFNDIYRKLFNVQRGASMSTIYVNKNLYTFKINVVT